MGPNERTAWAESEGSGDGLELKEPITEHDPNVGTVWADTPKPNRPVQRVRREIDAYLEKSVWACPECGWQALSETGQNAHLAAGPDGLTACKRAKLNFRPMKDCKTCGGKGTGQSVCSACNGSGEGVKKSTCSNCAKTPGYVQGADGPVECSYCDGRGERTTCARCAGKGRVEGCQACGGSGKIPLAEGETQASVNADEIAEKVGQVVGAEIAKGFQMLAGILKPGAEKKPARKGKKGASSGSIRREARPRRSESVPAVERKDQPVADPSPKPEEA